MKRPRAAEVTREDGYTSDVAKRTPKARRVSHQDIAREANVSRVTVSLVLAGKDQTSEETRRRVMEVATRLQYRPNLLVRGMQTGRSHTIGVIIPASMHFHSQIARGIHDELIAVDYVPIQLWVDPAVDTKATELEQIHRLVDRRMDGVIIWPADVSVPDVHFREIWQRNIPLVTVDRETTTHADHVGTDEELGGRLAAEHLLALGHRRIAHVTFPGKSGSVFRRGAAFVKLIEAAGGTCEFVTGRTEDLDGPVRALLSRQPLPTAIFAATDPMAMKVYSAAASVGLRIPQDLSVVGYADFPFARDLVPPLTTVRQDPYQMGRLAAQVLLDRIFDRCNTDVPRIIRITPELIIRRSTAPSPRK
jgi:LacI family transcriptional regulator